MLSLVAGCAPDNIKTPIPSDKPSPEQNDPTQKPDENDGSSEQTPEKQPETVHVPFVNIVPEKESNTDVMPQASVDGIEFCDTASLKDKTLKMFVREGGAFYAGKLSEQEWLDALKDELGLTVEKTVTSNSTLYSKQLIASKTGKGADLVTVDMNNVFASLNLMKTPLESFDAEETDIPFSLAAFNMTGGKVFTGIGNARVLWYNKNIIKDDSPFKLYKDGGWTFDVFASHLVSTQSNKQALFDTYSNLIPFTSAAGKQTTGIVNGEYVIDLESDEAKKAAQEYDTLFAKDGAKCDKSHSFVRGNTAFLFAATPNVNGFDVGFAPVPACAEGASGVSELCGTGLGIVDFAFTARKLKEAGYAGDMFLHGIYDEDDMLRSIAHWKAAMKD